jgi:hypothetical protein
MIPVDNAENPWKSIYPSTALQDSSAASRALYHAIIAQSAFNISNLNKENRETHCQKESVALKHYGASLRELSQSLDRTKEAEYNACAATLYTLMISEVSRPDIFNNSWLFLFPDYLLRATHEVQSLGGVTLMVPEAL